MRLSALDCVRRGLLNFRANWELVLVQLAGGMLVAVVFAIGLLPIFFVVGFAVFRSIAGAARGSFQGGSAAAEALSRAVAGNLLPLALALVATACVWTVALIVYSYFQGGTLGVLMAGERRAALLRESGWPEFRTFSLAAFAGWARRYVWRYFWLINLFGAIGLAVAAVALSAVALAALAGRDVGPAALVAVGCGLALLVVPVAVFFALWFNLAQAELARETSATLAASRRSLAILFRRPGAVLLVFLMMLAAAIVLTVVFLTASLTLDFALQDHFVVRLGVSLAMSVVQGAANGALAIAFAATLVALVRGEEPVEGGA